VAGREAGHWLCCFEQSNRAPFLRPLGALMEARSNSTQTRSGQRKRRSCENGAQVFVCLCFCLCFCLYKGLCLPPSVCGAALHWTRLTGRLALPHSVQVCLCLSVSALVCSCAHECPSECVCVRELQGGARETVCASVPVRVEREGGTSFFFSLLAAH